MVSPNVPVVKRARKPQAPSGGLNTTAVVGGVVGLIIIGVLLSLWPDSSSGASGPVGYQNNALNKFFKDNDVAMSGVAVYCGEKCVLHATRPIQSGEVVMKISPTSILDPRSIAQTDIGKVISADNFTVVQKHGSQELGPAWSNLFMYTFFLAMSKKDPNSKLRPWLDALPAADKLGGAIFWDPEMDQCVEISVSGEGNSLREILKASNAAAKELCETVEGGCPNGVPTEDEMKWALGTYLHRNFQDQAILYGVDFAAIDNSKTGLLPQWNAEEQVLEVHAGSNVKKGEALNVNFQRGPGTLLVSQGWFDDSSVGVDARIRLQDDGDKLKKKHCVDRHAELLFTAAGYPRDALINCIGVLVATPELRRDFKKNVKNSKELRSYIYGNLTGLLQNYMEDNQLNAISETATPQCFNVKSSLAASMEKYRQFYRTVLKSNHEHCFKKFKELAPERIPEVTYRGARMPSESGSVTLDPEDVKEAPEDAPETP